MAGNPEGKVAPSALAITAHMAKQRKKGRPTYQDDHLKAPTHRADSVGLAHCWNMHAWVSEVAEQFTIQTEGGTSEPDAKRRETRRERRAAILSTLQKPSCASFA